MPSHYVVCVAVLLLTAVALPLAAQGLQPPSPTAGGMFGRGRAEGQGEPSQQFTLTFDAFGGYDDNIQAGMIVEPGDPTVPQDGYVGRVAMGMTYRRGRANRFFEGSGLGYFNRQTVYGSTTHSMAGGEATVQGSLPLTPRTGVRVQLGAAYEPTFLFNASGSMVDDPEAGGVPAPGPIQGITDQRWLNNRATGGVFRNWTPRQVSELTYATGVREPVSGPGWYSRWQSLSARHAWTLRPTSAMEFAYTFEERRSEQGAVSQPLQFHSAVVGLRHERRFSPLRSLEFNLAGGTTETRIVSGADIHSLGFVPVMSGSMRLDLSRAWVASAALRRDVTVLEGLSPEAFATNSVSSGLEGLVGSRVQMNASVTYSRADSLVDTFGGFESKAALAQMQYALAPCCAVFASYTHYQHRVIGVSGIDGFPTRYRRNSAQVGVTFWLPLVSRF